MLFIQTAWKNIFRYKRRTLITAVAIAVGVICSIALDGFLYGMEEDSNRNLIWYESGAAKFYPKDYFADRKIFPSDFLIEKDDRAEIEAELTRLKIPFSPRYITRAQLFFTEEYFPAAGSADVVLVGIDPKRDAQVMRIADHIESGGWFTEPEGAVVGSWLAEDIGAKTGAVFTVQTKGRGGFFQTIDVPVTGIALTDNPVVNMTYVFMDIGYLDEMLELDGALTDITISFDKTADTALIDREYPKLQTAFASSNAVLSGRVELYSWKENYAEIVQLMASKASISMILLAFIFIIAAVGISNTMLMAVMERKNEVAMLKTLGYTNFQIKCLFMYEGIFIGLLGIVIGAVLGTLLNFYMVNVGIDMTFAFKGVDMGYRVTGIMRSAWHWQIIGSVAIGAFVVSALFSYLPVGGMVKKEIADLFRKV